MSRKSSKVDARKEAILDAADEIFVEKGYAGTLMREVAEKSHVAQGLIHYYFKSKEGLWGAVKQRYANMFGEALLPLLENRYFDEEFIKIWARRFLSFWRENPNWVRILLWRLLEGKDDPWEGVKLLYEFGVKKIRESQGKGYLRPDVEPGHFIYLLAGAHLYWINNRDLYCLNHGLDPDDEQVDQQYLRDLLEVLLRGMLPQGEK